MESRTHPARTVIPAGTALWRIHSGPFPPHLLVARERVTAVADRYLTDLPFTAAGDRVIARQTMIGDVLSTVRTTVDLSLAPVRSAPDLAGLHAELPWAHGVEWPSPVDVPRRTIALFTDRCPPMAPTPVVGLDGAEGAALLSDLLSPYHVHVPRPDGELLVFINYRSNDESPAAHLLDESLRERLGASAVFLDDRSIGYGDDFAVLIEENVRRTKVLVSVIGPRWEENYDEEGRRAITRTEDWVRLEIAEALAHDVIVVPILVGARPKLTEDVLPDELLPMVRLQRSHLPERYTRADIDRAVDKLVDDLPVLRTRARPRPGEEP